MSDTLPMYSYVKNTTGRSLYLSSKNGINSSLTIGINSFGGPGSMNTFLLSIASFAALIASEVHLLLISLACSSV